MVGNVVLPVCVVCCGYSTRLKSRYFAVSAQVAEVANDDAETTDGKRYFEGAEECRSDVRFWTCGRARRRYVLSCLCVDGIEARVMVVKT